eukprot:gene14270-19146_t
MSELDMDNSIAITLPSNDENEQSNRSPLKYHQVSKLSSSGSIDELNRSDSNSPKVTGNRLSMSHSHSSDIERVDTKTVDATLQSFKQQKQLTNSVIDEKNDDGRNSRTPMMDYLNRMKNQNAAPVVKAQHVTANNNTNINGSIKSQPFVNPVGSDSIRSFQKSDVYDQSIRSSSLPYVRPNRLNISNDTVYHKNTFSEQWFLAFIIAHLVQFGLLLSMADITVLPIAATVVVGFLALLVVFILIYARLVIKKSRLSSYNNIKIRGGVCTPDDEADMIPNRAIYALAFAAVVDGFAYAIYASITAGNKSGQNPRGFFSQETILQTLRFASITLLAFHRVIRPANRIDPMRTMLE